MFELKYLNQSLEQNIACSPWLCTQRSSTCYRPVHPTSDVTYTIKRRTSNSLSSNIWICKVKTLKINKIFLSAVRGSISNCLRSNLIREISHRRVVSGPETAEPLPCALSRRSPDFPAAVLVWSSSPASWYLTPNARVDWADKSCFELIHFPDNNHLYFISTHLTRSAVPTRLLKPRCPNFNSF